MRRAAPDSPVTATRVLHRPWAGGREGTAFTLEGSRIRSNTFELGWPPRSGRIATFPEMDRAGRFAAAAARERMIGAQRAFVDRPVEKLAVTA